jgi:hypothetical protein
MQKHRFLSTALAVVPVVFAFSTSAHAQATRTWVSGVGDDANPCSRTAPCKTFPGAISKTAPGGEINCLDGGGFGQVTVTKSMTISCGDAGTAGIVFSSGSAINFNGGATDYLYVKGLDIEGLSKTGTSSSVSGISFNSGAILHVEDCIIRNVVGSGITIKPIHNADFIVTRTTLFHNGSGATGAGIQVRPTGGSTSGVIDAVVAYDNVFGIAADGGGGATGINISVRNSTISRSAQIGVVATTGAVGTGIMVTRSSVSNNNIGLQTIGAGAVLRVGESEITGNGTGVSGVVSSFGTNQLAGNGSDGVLTLLPAPALH